MVGTVILLSGTPIDDSGGASRMTQIALELAAGSRRCGNFDVLFVNRYPKAETKDVTVSIAAHLHVSTMEAKYASFANVSAWRDLVGEKSLRASARACGRCAQGRPLVLVEFPHPDYVELALALQKSLSAIIVYDMIDHWPSLGAWWYNAEVRSQR